MRVPACQYKSIMNIGDIKIKATMPPTWKCKIQKPFLIWFHCDRSLSTAEIPNPTNGIMGLSWKRPIIMDHLTYFLLTTLLPT